MSAYHVAIDGEPRGPLSRAEVIALIAKGKIEADTKIWEAGTEAWAAASSFVEFAGHFATRAAIRRAEAPAEPKPEPSRRLDINAAVEAGLAAYREMPWRSYLGGSMYYLGVLFANTAVLVRFLLPMEEGAPPPVPTPAEAAPWMIGLLIYGVVLRAGFGLFMLRVLRGETAAPALVFSGLKRAKLKVLVPYALLYGLAVFAGLSLLILPGIFLAVAFSLGFYIVMESDLGPIAAMRESWRAVMSLGWWPVFAVYAVGFAGVIALVTFSGMVGQFARSMLIGELLQMVLSGVWAALTGLVIAAVYEQARRNRERAGAPAE